MKIRLILLAVLATSLIACRSDVAYTDFKHVDIEEWFRSDTLVFHISPMPQANSLKSQLVLRMSPDYQFQNLSLIVNTAYYKTDKPHTPYKISTDTLECRLADDNGQLAGRGVFHREFIVALPQLRLPEADSTVVTVSHNMQRIQIAGVESIGLQLLKQ